MRLNEILQAIKGRKEFFVRRHEGVVTIHHVSGSIQGFDEVPGAVFDGFRFDESTGLPLSNALIDASRKIHCDICGPANMNQCGWVCRPCREGARLIFGKEAVRTFAMKDIHKWMV